MTLSVRVRGLCVRFGAHTLFENLQLDLPAQRWTCLLGRSGIGKSTLSRIVSGFGIEGELSGTLTSSDGGSLQGQVAWMAQQDLLLPWLNVMENVTLGARLRGEPRRDVAKAQELIERTGLGGHESQLPATLSGGMRQRVALARTLMEAKPVVVLDEPFAAVDALTRLELQTLAFELLADKAILLITHDPVEALRLGHQVFVLNGSPAHPVRLQDLPGEPLRELSDARIGLMQTQLVDMLR
jgi:putative hydroxymethylpyrimidine transport system ATP-binding protein